MIIRNLFLTNREFQDLNPIVAGEESCRPGHCFGPYVRHYTLIHYVLKGKGTLYARGGEFPVHSGQAFLILPEEVTTYVADSLDPWHYQWIGFDGRLSEDFKSLPPVFDLSGEYLSRIVSMAQFPYLPEHQVAAELFRLYCALFTRKGVGSDHVQRVKNYIQSSYMTGITVTQIAEEMNLDRRYLTRLFREKTGFSIQQYLMDVRLSEACNYLSQHFSVREAATLCGYEDPSNFSLMFKRKYGISPDNWKKQRG